LRLGTFGHGLLLLDILVHATIEPRLLFGGQITRGHGRQYPRGLDTHPTHRVV